MLPARSGFHRSQSNSTLSDDWNPKTARTAGGTTAYLQWEMESKRGDFNLISYYSKSTPGNCRRMGREYEEAGVPQKVAVWQEGLVVPV